MHAARHPSWFLTAVAVGLVYAIVGIVFALPTGHARMWRLGAWGVSGVAYAIHTAYECLRVRNPPLTAALHVSCAAALGALGLAVGAIVHSLSITTTHQHQRLLLVALAAWPVITGVPAFLVGLGTSSLLARMSSRGRSPQGD